MTLPTISSGLLFGLLGATAWGFWALFTKLATRSAAPPAVLVISYLVAGVIGVGFLLSSPADFSMETRDLGWAVAAGVATGLGSLFYYTGLDAGSVSVVSTVTALYFVVSVILGVLVLGEVLTLQKGLGILLAVVAVGLLAG
jgi:transporter family protein